MYWDCRKDDWNETTTAWQQSIGSVVLVAES